MTTTSGRSSSASWTPFAPSAAEPTISAPGIIAAETSGETQLYERHSALVYRYCLRMLGSREDAEDAAQTTFFQALRALRRGVVPSFEQA